MIRAEARQVISNIYHELRSIPSIQGEVNLNIDPDEGKLEFVLRKYLQWREYTFYQLLVNL
ncbi:MAG TPA: hypothetical protein DIT04_01635 [Dysgonomonas sp.]|nr:hypothetical protein [Dysgonomonas sp.]